MKAQRVFSSVLSHTPGETKSAWRRRKPSQGSGKEKNWMKTRWLLSLRTSGWAMRRSWIGNGGSEPKGKARGRGRLLAGGRMPNPEASEGNGRDWEPVAGQSYWCETEGPIEEAVG